MLTAAVERALLENLLDALDTVYDQREFAEWWTESLLVATAVALEGTAWSDRIDAAAKRLKQIRTSGLKDPAERNRQALVATGELREHLARAV
jgi:hypothetical protein